MSNAPYSNFQYTVEIDGAAQAGFAEVTGIGVEVQAVEYREASDRTFARKIPGAVRFPNVVLKRGIVNRQLWQWMETVLDGAVQKAQVTIVLLDEARAPVARFVLRNAWPCKWEGPSLAAKGNDIAMETLELAHEALEVEFA